MATMAVALMVFISCQKEETGAEVKNQTTASMRTSGDLSLIVQYNDNQTDTIVVDSFITVVYGLNQMSLHAWYGGSSAGSYIASTVTANHSGGLWVFM